MLGIFADAIRIATRNAPKDKANWKCYLHRQAAKENDDAFHKKMMRRAARFR